MILNVFQIIYAILKGLEHSKLFNSIHCRLSDLACKKTHTKFKRLNLSSHVHLFLNNRVNHLVDAQKSNG